MTEWITQDPQDRLDYLLNYADAIPEDDFITSSTWTCDDGITVEDGGISDRTVTFWASGGVAKENYRATNHIITMDGREIDFTVGFRIREQ